MPIDKKAESKTKVSLTVYQDLSRHEGGLQWTWVDQLWAVMKGAAVNVGWSALKVLILLTRASKMWEHTLNNIVIYMYTENIETLKILTNEEHSWILKSGDSSLAIPIELPV